MAIYENEEVVGFRVGSAVVCDECLEEAERKELTGDTIITREEVEEKYAFCDRCGESLD